MSRVLVVDDDANLRDLVSRDLLSGRVEENEIAAGRAMGAAYLTKPFSANALTRTIQKLAPVDTGW